MAKLRILVVDDEKSIAELEELWLIDLGFAVDVHLSAVDALADADQIGSYDIIMTDYTMPIIDGRMFLRKLREKNVSAPAIMVTGEEFSADERRVFTNLGVVAFLFKPFRAIELEIALNIAAETAEKTTSDTLQASP